MTQYLDELSDSWSQLDGLQRQQLLQLAQEYAEEHRHRVRLWKEFFDYLLGLGAPAGPPKNPESSN